MSNIPYKVKVAGVNYQVHEVDGLIANDSALGRVLYHKTEIQLDCGMSVEKKEQVFIHELLHAIFNESGFEEQDEDMVNRLAITLHQVLKDNDLKLYKE